MKGFRIVRCALLSVVLVFGLTWGKVGRAQQEGGGSHSEPTVSQAVQPAENFVPGRILLKFRAGTSDEHARGLLAAYGARAVSKIPGIDVHIVELPPTAVEEQFVETFSGFPEVEFTELDRIVPPADITPNDPWYANWQWGLRKISGPTAWSTTTGSNALTIAILDTGVEGTHPDLAAKLVPGWNVYNNNSDTSDVYGHGTQVAGAAAASSNNSAGVTSVCWSCQIMPVRISDTNGNATYSAMAGGLNWAADHGARVANISYEASDSSTVTTAAKYFQDKGGVVTSSAGNEATFDPSADNPYILTVSGTDPNDVLYSWSNTGNNVDFAAPGSVATTIRGGSYAVTSGTSFSAPIVAGVAALVLSVNPSLTPAQVQDILKQSADDIGAAGWDSTYGWGRVNAARAVSMAGGSSSTADTTPPTLSITSPAAGATVSGTVSVQMTASDNVGVSSVSLSVDGVALGTVTAAPFNFSWDTTTASNATHTLTATAKDAAGNTGTSAAVSVTVSNSAVGGSSADTTPPSVNITSPGNGAAVSGNVSVYVSAADNVGVVRVELYVDGTLVSTSTTSPFTTKWNTNKAAKGAHTLQCKTYDAASNAGLSQPVTVYK